MSRSLRGLMSRARLPSPQLLVLHAACARIARMSGAAEALNELERGVEDTRVLVFGGSFPRWLNHFISSFTATSWISQRVVVVFRLSHILYIPLSDIHRPQRV